MGTGAREGTAVGRSRDRAATRGRAFQPGLGPARARSAERGRRSRDDPRCARVDLSLDENRVSRSTTPEANGSAPASTRSLAAPSRPSSMPGRSWRSASARASAISTWPSPMRHWPGPAPSPATSLRRDGGPSWLAPRACGWPRTMTGRLCSAISRRSRPGSERRAWLLPPHGPVHHPEQAQRMAGRMVGHAVRVVGAHVLETQDVGQEHRQLERPGGEPEGTTTASYPAKVSTYRRISGSACR